MNERLEPSPISPSYIPLRALAVQLKAEAGRRLGWRSGLSFVDVGCGERPYEPLFRRWAGEYVGVDSRPGPGVDVVAGAESLPFEDARFDCAVCTQLLEHAGDPAAVVAELHRVLRSGGVAFVSTHGVIRYHPNPDDYWRWTHAGLERLFADAGEWESVDVYPNGGTASAIASLISQQLTSAAQKLGEPRLAWPAVGALNAFSWRLDRAHQRLFAGRPPDLAPNYLAVACASERV